jgi:hypothetical protein
MSFSVGLGTTFEICDLCNNSIHEDCCELANSLTTCYACIGHTHINNQKDQSSNELENTVEQANTSAAIKCGLLVCTLWVVFSSICSIVSLHFIAAEVFACSTVFSSSSRNRHLRSSILMKMPEMGNLH